MTSYNIKDQAKVVLNAMKSSGAFDLVKKEFQNPNKKTCGIRRTAGDTIKRIWKFWNKNSTVSNNQTSHPSKPSIKADLFDNDPLLCEIVLEHWNVEEHYQVKKGRFGDGKPFLYDGQPKSVDGEPFFYYLVDGKPFLVDGKLF